MKKIHKFLIIMCCAFTTLTFANPAEVIRDPTTPLVKDASSIVIQGISESEGVYFCVINNRIYQEGSKILDFKISKIELEKVFFEDQQGKITENSL